MSSQTSYTRRITLYINDKEVTNDIASIQKEFYKANNELRKMTLGSEQYNNQLHKVAGLKSILQEHQAALKQSSAAIEDMTNNIEAQEQVINKSSGSFSKLGDNLSAVPGPAGAAVTGIQSLGKALWGLMANPIVAIIAGVVAVFILLYKAFKSTDEGATKLEGVFKGLSNVFDVVIDRASDIADAFVSLLKLDFKNFGANIKKAFSGIGKEIVQTASAGFEYAQAMDDIEDREAAAQARMAKLRVDIENLKNQAKDRTKTDKERMEAAKEAMDKEIELNKLETKFLAEKNAAEIKNMATKIQNSKMTIEQKEAQLETWLKVDDMELNSMLQNDKAFADFYNKNSTAFQELQKTKSDEILKEAELATGTRRLQSELTGFMKEMQDERARDAEEAYKKQEEKLTAAQSKERLLLKKSLYEKGETTEKVNLALKKKEMEHLEEKLQLQKKYGKDTTEIENSILDMKVEFSEMEKEEKKKTAEDLKQQREKEIKDLESNLKLQQEAIKLDGVKTKQTDQEINSSLLAAQAEFLKKKLALQKEWGEDTTETELQIAQNATAIAQNALKDQEDFLKQLDELKNKYLNKGIDATIAKLDEEKAILQKAFDEKKISEEEFNQASKNINEKAAQERYSIIEKYLQATQKLFSYASEFTQALEDAELAKAGNNEAKKEEIQRKYAKKRKVIAIGQAVIDGALAIVNILKTPATGNLIADSILKGVEIALVAGTTAAQISKINSTQFSEGGFTERSGSDSTPVGVVHANEWVASAPLLRDPDTRRHIDYLEAKQRGLIPSFRTAFINDTIRQRGFQSGGFTGQAAAPDTDSTEMKEIMKNLIVVMDANSKASAKLANKKLTVNSQEVFNKQNEYEHGVENSNY